MQHPVPPDAVVVSTASFESDEPADIVESNISFLNSLFAEYLTAEEVSADALRSYYVDYYLAEVNNGGFSQFVYNSRWVPKTVSLVREGLRAIGAERHREVFEEGARLVEGLGPEGLQAYLAGEYFGENEERDGLNGVDDLFGEADAEEDLLELNAAWLRSRPGLVILSPEQMREEARRRGAALPDRERRIAEARANEPRYMKLIRALCERAGHELKKVTAGDPTRVHEGQPVVGWHFLTDQGHFHMVGAGGTAIMFRGRSTTERICELDVPEE